MANIIRFMVAAPIVASIFLPHNAGAGEGAVRRPSPPQPAIANGGIVKPLTAAPGDPVRGRLIAIDREKGNCTVCHALPTGDVRFQGTVGPSLLGVGLRLDDGVLRLRLIDGAKLNPETIMPSYLEGGTTRVARGFRGATVLTPQEIEDVIAYLRDPPDLSPANKR